MNRPLIGSKRRLFSCIPGIFLLAFIVISMPSISAAEDDNAVTVTSTGVAAIVGNNTAVARQAAIDDALRKAIEQTVGMMVSSRTMVGNYQVLKDTVYTRSRGYIKNYSILNESQGPGIYQVSIRATVSAGSLKNDLSSAGLLNAGAERPRVLFMIAEQNVGQKYYKFWRGQTSGEESSGIPVSDVTLKEIFLRKGFSVVDISGTTGKIGIGGNNGTAEPPNEGALTLARKLNAEIVIKGKALATEGPRTAGDSVGVYLADMEAQAIKVDTGEVLASASSHATARSISPSEGGAAALSRAASELADKLTGQILDKLSRANNIILKIIGVSDYKDVSDFKELLTTQISGIQAVYQRKFEGGEATFEVESRISANDLADEISGLPGEPYKIFYTSANTVEVVVNPSSMQQQQMNAP